jgi:hypothetical protein
MRFSCQFSKEIKSRKTDRIAAAYCKTKMCAIMVCSSNFLACGEIYYIYYNEWREKRQTQAKAARRAARIR